MYFNWLLTRRDFSVKLCLLNYEDVLTKVLQKITDSVQHCYSSTLLAYLCLYLDKKALALSTFFSSAL